MLVPANEEVNGLIVHIDCFLGDLVDILFSITMEEQEVISFNFRQIISSAFSVDIHKLVVPKSCVKIPEDNLF